MNKFFTKAVSIITATFLLAGMLPFYAYAQDITEYLTYSVIRDEITITDCDTSLSGDISIPEQIEGLPVTVIDEQAFRLCKYITSVTVPSTVREIGMEAFEYCNALESINLNSGLEKLGSFLFYDCKLLKNIDLPDTLKDITERAFAGTSVTAFSVSDSNQYYTADEYGVLFTKDMKTLVQYPLASTITAYTIPDSVTDIANYAFMDAKKLEAVTIPQSVKVIGEESFRSCSRLSSITIPDSTESIGRYAFQGSGLKTVHIGAGVNSIGISAFDYCTRLESATVSNNNTVFFADANGIIYDSNNGLITILPQRLKIQDYQIPDGITTLKSITLPSSLEELSIPASVTQIDTYCFEECTKLKRITVDADNTAYSSDSNGILYNEFKTLLILCPPNNPAASVKIPYGVEIIRTESFMNCTALEEITIPRSVTSISVDAFKGCSSLSTVNYTGTQEQWNNISISSGNTALTDLEINCNTADPDEAPLGGTEGFFTFKTADGKATITYVDPSAEGELIIPEKISGCPVIAIADQAFKNVNNYKITSVYIPEYLVTLSDILNAPYEVSSANPAFSSDESGILFNKDKTELIKYPSTNTQTHYTIPTNVKKIARDAFERCTALKTIDISPSITVIDRYVFKNCSFESITIPDTVTKLESCAFNNCRIGEIYIGKGVEETHSSNNYAPAFYNTNGLKRITVSPENTHFCNDENGILYSKDMKTLVLYPQGCELEHFTVPSEVENISSPFGTIEAGGNITALKTITVTENTKEIESNFKYVKSLEKIEVSQSNPYFSSNEDGMLFDKKKTVLITVPSMCSSEEIIIPDSVTDIGSAFYGCTEIEAVNMPDSVVSWDIEAFSGCKKLKSIKLSDGLVNIPVKAFQSCEKLESIIIPDSILSIDAMAFAYCANLKSIYYTSSEESWNNITIYEAYNQNLLNAEIHFNYGAVTGSCGENTEWSFNEINGTLTISGNGTVEEKASFEEYGWYSFKDSIRYIEAYDGIENIPANAFTGCPLLNEVYLGKNVTSVGDNAFASCESLSVFTSHASNISIADTALKGHAANLTFICPSENISLISVAGSENAACITVSFDGEKKILSFNGELTVYSAPRYSFLSKFLAEHLNASYIYFEKLVFDGVEPDIILPDFEGADSSAQQLTLTNLYVNLAVVKGDTQENITFEEMLELLESGDYDAFKYVIDSDDIDTEKTFIQKVEDFFTNLTNNALRAISSVINFIAKLFRRK